MSEQEKLEWIRARRDEKVRMHLEQYAPVWLVEEKPILKDDAMLFNVVFFHPQYEWVSRRYQFDAFNNVLYYQGQVTISEAEALAYAEKRPYIPAETINMVDSYGG